MIKERIENSQKDIDQLHYKMANNIDTNLVNLLKISIKYQLEK